MNFSLNKKNKRYDYTIKVFRIMRFTLIFFIVGIVQAFAANTYSQSEVINLRLSNVTIEDVINHIEEQSEFRFLYNKKIVNVERKTSIIVTDHVITDALDELFRNTDISYMISDRYIVLNKRNALFRLPLSAQQNTKRVTGIVTDANGETLPSVNITIKGTGTGVTTDLDGQYSIDVPNERTVLTFSFIGYRPQDITVGNRAVVNVSLNEDVLQMEEVVVIGYGSQRKSDLTGAIVSVKGNDLTQFPTMRPDQALQGRAAGVSIQQTDGAPGGNVMIRIRGGNSISGGNEALVVVDGLQGADLSVINPNDIESMEVLKDASATAIYGARGANGVILITTKRGKSGKPVFNYNYSIGVQNLRKRLDLLDGAGYAEKSNQYTSTLNIESGSQITPILPFTSSDIEEFRRTGGTDWQAETFRTGILQNHQLSMSGGSDQFMYFVSGGYLDQEGILINSNYQRYNIRTNLDSKITSWLNAGISLNLMKAKGNVPPVGEGTTFGDILGQVINTIPRFDPCTPVYDSNGNYNFYANRANRAYADYDVWNPVATALETVSERNTILSEVNAYLEFKFLKDFTLRITGSASITSEDYLKYHGSKTQPGRGTNGRGNFESSLGQYFQNSNILTYNKTIEDHRVVVTAVAEQQASQSKLTYIDAQGFFSDDTGIKDLAGASQINERYNDFSKRGLNSYLGRVNYSFQNKYLVTASVRADGSSVFGENNKWGYFPSGSLAWKVTEEKFMEGIAAVISNLKIRGSWGKTGSQGISPYQTLPTISSGTDYPYMGTGARNIGYSLSLPANPDLKWETTTQTDIGVDLGFFGQRLMFTADIYKKKTVDLLLAKQVPAYTGFATALYNIGSIENKGLEMSIEAVPVMTNDFSWNTNFNISFNRSKVLQLASDLPLRMRTNPGGGYQFWSNNWALKQLVVGQPVEQMYGYVNLGTWGTSEASEAFKYGQLPGDSKWKDVNEDGKIDLSGDGNEIIGDATPKFYYGWNNNISYKNFNLSFLIQGSYGNDIFNAVRIKLESPNNGTSAKLMTDRWTPENQHTNIPAFTSGWDRNQALLIPGTEDEFYTNETRYIGADTRSSRWVEDGSYIRLKNITLSYNLPSSLLRAFHIQNLMVYVAGANLITITKYTGYDPEVSSFNRTSGGTGGLGIDLSNYPTSKTVSFGINLTF
jgi:TonB-linked SusC/RagA family outer membrane protein